MTKRTRLFVFISGGILAAGLGTGLVAAYVGGFQALGILSPAADELSYLPSDAKAVAFANVREIMDSELHQKLRAMAPRNDQGLAKFEEETGVDVTKDVDYVFAALGSGDGRDLHAAPLFMARGRFDNVRIEGLVRSKGGVVEDYKGVRLLTVAEPNGSMNGGLAFVKPGLIAMGELAAVRRAIDAHGTGAASAATNDDLMRVIKGANDGNAWVVARFDALSAAGQVSPEIVQRLPAINWLTVSGHVNGGVRAAIRAEARDEAAAKNLREVVTGMLALAKLGAGQHAEVSALVNSIELGGDGNNVSLGLSVPIEVIDALGALRSAGGAPALPLFPGVPVAPDAPAASTAPAAP